MCKCLRFLYVRRYLRAAVCARECSCVRVYVFVRCVWSMRACVLTVCYVWLGFLCGVICRPERIGCNTSVFFAGCPCACTVRRVGFRCRNVFPRLFRADTSNASPCQYRCNCRSTIGKKLTVTRKPGFVFLLAGVSEVCACSATW